MANKNILFFLGCNEGF